MDGWVYVYVELYCYFYLVKGQMYVFVTNPGKQYNVYLVIINIAMVSSSPPISCYFTV